MKLNYKISLLLMLVVCCANAQFRIERDYKKTFHVPENGKVVITNKYGEVIIRTWNKDSVKFAVLLKAEGRNNDMVNKAMNRVEVRFHKAESVVTATTEVTKGRGFLTNVMKEVEGVVGGSNKLTIDYQVWIPEGVDLTIENKFGDVYMADLGGKVDLNISHGDIKANHVAESLHLKHSFGKVSFASINEATFSLRGSEIKIDEANSLDFESASSELMIDKARDIEFNSRNDKIKLSDVDRVVCKGSFTDLTVELVKTSVRLDFSYGDIYLTRINKDFDNIDITGKSTDINLVIDQASYVKTFIKGSEKKMVLPNSMLTMKKETFEDEDLISLSGFVGNTNTRYSTLSIDAGSGELIIAIKETPIFTDRD